MLLPIMSITSQLSFAERLVFTQSGSDNHFHMSASLHDINGEAQQFKGYLDIDESECSGEVSIDAKSITTFLGKQDDKMHSETIQVSRFPEVLYIIHSIEGRIKSDHRSTP
ncbi:MAG: YceI family protein [Myxococcota bacterium]